MTEETIKKNVYIIIGEGKCGKSSLCRALTGVFKSKLTWIRLRNEIDIEIKVWSQSRQEALQIPADTLSMITNDRAPNVLITLRFEPAPQMAPHMAQEYYDLIAANHNVVGVVFMGEGRDLRMFPTIPGASQIDLCFSRPVNANAAWVRNWWGWQ